MTEHQNVDHAEIAKFEAVAERWWDQEGEFKPLHQINPLRLDFISQHCGGLFERDVVDIGCGGGILSESMAKLSANVTGIDMGAEPLSVAKLHALESGVKVNYQQSTAEAFANDYSGQFDTVTCMEMLEHVPSPESVILACSKLLKPGGKAFFSTLNKSPKAYLFAILGAEYLLNMVPKGTHDFNKFIRPAELIGWAENAGLKIRASAGIDFNPLSGQFKLGQDVSVNYMLYFEKVA